MGYTHYYTPSKSATKKAWKSAQHDIKIFLAALPPETEAGPLLLEGMEDSGEPPIFTEDTIRFNGRGPNGEDLGHETFFVKFQGGWEFCKTARKPYDLAVTGALVILRVHGVLISASGDGGMEGFEDALEIIKTLKGLKFGSREEDLPKLALSADPWVAAMATARFRDNA
jgi:hypothetical protein